MRGALLTLFAPIVCPAQDVFDLPWRISADGELEVQRLVDGIGAKALQFGDWVPMFPGLLRRGAAEPERAWLLHFGPMKLLPLLVHGDGGAAAIDDATHRMRKLGIATSIDRSALRRLAREPLQDLLHVRHLATHDVYLATLALGDFAKDTKADAFTRAAAAEARARWTGWSADERADLAAKRVRRDGRGALLAGLSALPDDVDLVIGVHGAAMPPTAPLLAAWRHHQLRFASTLMLDHVGSFSPADETEAQLTIDRPGQLAFEVARNVGNWRVDHALLALRAGEHGGWWVHLGGTFQPARVAEGLRAGGFDVGIANEAEVQANVHGFDVRVTATELHAWSESLDRGSRGAHVPVLRDRADEGAAPVWAFVPAASRLAKDAGVGGTTLDVRFEPASGKASATAIAADEPGAVALLAAWRAWQAKRRCDPDAKIDRDTDHTWRDAAEAPPGVGEQYRTRLAWRRCVQAVRAERQGTTVRWTLDLAPFPLDDLVGLLGESPAVILRDG
jgi:hypothetical protein